ncbi:Soluble epoxide hydrolase [Fusarium oxysporum f. sp. cubense]|uniref:Soluble epoxide hydrolase n=1 Tax=Fusarium oxysporum f. sp. cubense TaxID=61366 RepID=A0A559LDY8_FUSOC|nr:Soluble epoxide hydrolase [Fusarium oxysporum f. sp. cubense]
MDRAFYTASLDNGVSIAYTDTKPDGNEKGVVVLIHGFPQTSYQFRKVIGPISSAGYRVITPDYRGAGYSHRTQTGFTKTAMASDILQLLDHLSIKDSVHIVGHDIGGMIAYTFASRYSDRTASVIWGECPLPGTQAHEDTWKIHGVQHFHFWFHQVLDLPEALVSGREEIYLGHFYDKYSYNSSAITQEDLNYYVKMFSRPGALRCGFNIYRKFGTDSEENREWVAKNGKCKVRALGLNGGMNQFSEMAEQMMGEVHEKGTFSVASVPESGHWIAEENPEGFVKAVLEFVGKE